MCVFHRRLIMKLIVAIVQDYDADRLLRAVTASGFRVTRISSVGGFLRNANTTLLIGVENAEVKGCLAIIRTTCSTRVHSIDDETEASWIAMEGGEITNDAHGGAVVLILRVERFERLYAQDEVREPVSS
jgi:uncharacterized protein YaaQ